MTSVETGEDYVRLVASLAPPGTNSPQAIDATNAVWDEWEAAGFARGPDTREVIEDPNRIFVAYYNDIITANRLGKHPVHYCYAKTGDLNAYASTTANGDYVIVFDSDFHRLINGIVIPAIVCVYSKPSDDDVEFYFSYMLEEIAQFKEQKNAFANPEDFTKIILKDYELTMLGSYCGAAIYAYIICHELAHHLAGHTSTSRKMAISSSRNYMTHISVNNTSHNEEFEADCLGYKLYTNIPKDYDKLENLKLNTQFLSLPLAFFDLLKIIDNLFPSEGLTHPAPPERLERLQQYKKQLRLDEDTEFYDALTEVLNGFATWCGNKQIKRNVNQK